MSDIVFDFPVDNSFVVDMPQAVEIVVEFPQEVSHTIVLTSAQETKLDGIQAGAEVNVNADWNASSGDAMILNKPNLSAYSLTTHNHSSLYQPLATVLTNTTASFTTAQESKLSGISAGAEVNVNADWNASSGDAMILNKPTIPSISGCELTSNRISTLSFSSNTANDTGYPTVKAVFDAYSSADNSVIAKVCSREIGVQFNSSNYYLLATITANSVAYSGASVQFEIFGQGRTKYTILVNAFLNSVPNAWDSGACSCDVIAPIGVMDSDSFTLIANYSTKTAKLYYRHVANAWNKKFIVGIDGYYSSSAIDLTRDITGVSSLPSSDFAIVTAVQSGVLAEYGGDGTILLLD